MNLFVNLKQVFSHRLYPAGVSRQFLARLLILAGLFCLGAWMAFRRSISTYWVLRNPITVTLTTFLFENAPPQLFNIEQEVLRYLAFTPYAFLSGCIIAIFVNWPLAIKGAAFWLGFSFTNSMIYFHEGIRLEFLAWYSLLPFAVGDWCTVPMYAIGARTIFVARNRHQFRISVLDLLSITTATALLLFVSLVQSEWLPPLVFLFLSTAFCLRICGLFKKTSATRRS